ncbi:MAG: NUDIX domain-containing protein [Candidatus Paceibacterota bacterium]|jgi:ADP-ribose pyrophosphatase YjhB (NUDIX family)
MTKTRFNFYAAVYLVMREGNNVLLIRRFNTGWMDGKYSLPAGHMEGNETSVIAMAREAKEEINIEILPEDLFVVHTMHRNSGDREYFDIFFEAKKYSGELKNNEENKCDEIGWFPIDNLPENALDYIKEALKKIREGQHFSSFGF